MTKHKDQQFIGSTMRLDGGHFENCVFTNCVLEIGATAAFQLDGCIFNKTDFVFVGPAMKMMQMLSMFYAEPGSRAFVEEVFRQIQSGTINRSVRSMKLPSDRFNA